MVARTVRDRKAASSSLATPTRQKARTICPCFLVSRSGSTETNTDAIGCATIAIPPRAFPKARRAAYKSRHSGRETLPSFLNWYESKTKYHSSRHACRSLCRGMSRWQNTTIVHSDKHKARCRDMNGLFLHGCYFWIKQKRRTIECVAFKLKRLIVFGRQIILCRLPLRRAQKRRLVLHFEIGSLGKSSKRNARIRKRFLPISCFSFRPSCA